MKPTFDGCQDTKFSFCAASLTADVVMTPALHHEDQLDGLCNYDSSTCAPDLPPYCLALVLVFPLSAVYKCARVLTLMDHKLSCLSRCDGEIAV